MTTDRKTLSVRTTSWHARLYAWWRNEPLPDRTNLCHYFWSIVLGVPAKALVVGVVAIFRPVLRPVWVVLRALGRSVARRSGALGRWLGPKIGRAMDTADEWVEDHSKALGGFLLGLLITGTVVALVLETIATLIVIGVLVGLAAIVVGFVTLGVLIESRTEHGRSQRRAARKAKRETKRILESILKEEDKGDGILKVFWAFIVAKKHKVCPFIEVVDDAAR